MGKSGFFGRDLLRKGSGRGGPLRKNYCLESQEERNGAHLLFDLGGKSESSPLINIAGGRLASLKKGILKRDIIAKGGKGELSYSLWGKKRKGGKTGQREKGKDQAVWTLTRPQERRIRVQRKRKNGTTSSSEKKKKKTKNQIVVKRKEN